MSKFLFLLSTKKKKKRKEENRTQIRKKDFHLTCYERITKSIVGQSSQRILCQPASRFKNNYDVTPVPVFYRVSDNTCLSLPKWIP